MIIFLFCVQAAANKQRRLAEQLSPVLSALCVLSRTEPIIRRFLKEQVLPPLDAKEAASLPEEGNTLRNKLVRLMTNPSTDVKEVVADFLFILCKESGKTWGVRLFIFHYVAKLQMCFLKLKDGAILAKL